jgi:hypothetical protein
MGNRVADCGGSLARKAVQKMKTVELTRGFAATVDDEDFERVICIPWHVSGTFGRPYARNTTWIRGAARYTYMHKLIIEAESWQRVDHIDGNTLNNCRNNLRLATIQQNNFNRNKSTRSKSSKFKGVSWDASRQKWMASIMWSGRSMTLGRFEDERTAALAYNDAARSIFGEFAKVNDL